jgi:hypothetical protein
MAKEPSLVVKRRNYSDIAQLRDPLVLEDFLDEPATFIAETITGMLGDGAKGVSASGGRIVQAILKGRAYKQYYSYPKGEYVFHFRVSDAGLCKSRKTCRLPALKGSGEATKAKFIRPKTASSGPS